MSTLKVGFSGTRAGMFMRQMETVNQLLIAWSHTYSECILEHGDCVGADSSADYFAHKAGYTTIVHPPLDNKLRAYCLLKAGDKTIPPAEYHVRNRYIVDSTDRLLAAPYNPLRRSGGTWFTIDYALSKKKPTYIVNPNGKLETYNA